MKKTFFLIVFILLTLWCNGQRINESTAYFEFHNNYWVNLHHFLYQKSQGSQYKKLKEDGFNFLAIGEDTVILNLSKSESGILGKAIEYYQANLINKDLERSELGKLRAWLQQQDEEKQIVDTIYSQEFTNILNNVSGIYRPKLWPIHKAQNQNVLDSHIETIRLLESRVINEMEQLAQYQWPDSTKVRVDLTAYANYAGAYTTTTPQMNIIISTLDSLNVTSSFIETIYHEGCHLLYPQVGPFRSEIFDKAKEMNIEFPRNLWHACLFYFCGRATQEALKTISLDHKMDMDVRHIFKGYNTLNFRNTLDKYSREEIDLKKTILILLTDLKNK